MNLYKLLALSIGVLLLPTAWAEERSPASTTASKPAQSEPVEEEADTIFGDWSGARKNLKEKGIELTFRYKADVVNNVSGGERRGTAYLGNVDLMAETDMEKLAGIKGMKLVLYGLGNHGAKPADYVGDHLGTSNIEAPSTFKLFEANIQQSIDDRTTLVFGLRDLNADFYSTPTSALLVNNGFGISSSLGQTGVNGPSVFPTTALALYVKYHSPTRFYFESGFFNATAGSANSDYGTRVTVDSKNGYLGICETGYAEDGGDRPFKYAVGIWNYTQPEESIDPSAPKQHNWGGYLLADHHWSKHFGGFLRYGIASPQMNEFSSVYEVGAEWREPVNGRTKDGIALGVVTGVASGAYRATTGSLAYERAIEATYSYHLAKGIDVQPDFQYIIQPGLSPDLKNATVTTFRFKLNF